MTTTLLRQFAHFNVFKVDTLRENDRAILLLIDDDELLVLLVALYKLTIVTMTTMTTMTTTDETKDEDDVLLSDISTVCDSVNKELQSSRDTLQRSGSG